MREFSGVDFEVLAFIERLGCSLLKLDLLKFFNRNPNIRDTSLGIALRVGREKEAVALELYDLHLLGIVEREEFDNTYVYYLNPDKGLRELLARALSELNF
ncbi:MAG: hypothetical protein RMK30_00865 [Anaerolineae bacterium]|nr:hypothetical protein [Anaerolineae bacterium]MDW8101414.1 hypothetical protein [Anaerolineae bacterium]